MVWNYVAQVNRIYVTIAIYIFVGTFQNMPYCPNTVKFSYPNS